MNTGNLSATLTVPSLPRPSLSFSVFQAVLPLFLLATNTHPVDMVGFLFNDHSTDRVTASWAPVECTKEDFCVVIPFFYGSAPSAVRQFFNVQLARTEI